MRPNQLGFVLGRQVILVGALASFPVFTGAAASEQGACLEQVRTIFRDKLDTTTWAPHRSVVTIRSANGKSIAVSENVIESPSRSIGTFKGSNESTLFFDGKAWVGQAPHGPWRLAPAGIVPQQIASLKQTHAQQLRNLRDAQCHGEQEFDGKRAVVYTYFTKTDPDPALSGFWFGGKARVYLDAASETVLRWDQFDTVGSSAFGAPGDVTEVRYVFDSTISIKAP
jgi:hypothetical protein